MPTSDTHTTPPVANAIRFISHSDALDLADGAIRSLHPLANTAIVVISGDAMAPAYPSGSMLLIDADVTSPSPAGIFILRDGDRYTAQRCQVELGGKPLMVHLLPDNSSHERQTVPASSLNVAGMVMCRIDGDIAEVNAN
jgi:hypothetical protein